MLSKIPLMGDADHLIMLDTDSFYYPRFGDILVAEKGWACESYKEEDGASYMKQQDLSINVDLGIGAASATVWTCDLTHGYITINADYRS